MADAFGVAEGAVIPWLSGRRRPDWESCNRISQATGKALADIYDMMRRDDIDVKEVADTSEQGALTLPGIRAVVEGIVREEGSVNTAARAIGMPQTTLHSIRNEAEPTISTLQLIAAYKRIPLWKLLREAERSR